MRTIKIYLLLLLPLLAVACDNFLKEDSADLLIPKDVNDYIPLLLGEGYPDKFSSQIGWTSLMTDDVEMGLLHYDPEMRADVANVTITEGVDQGTGDGELLFSWQRDYSACFTSSLTGPTNDFWESRYENILACNAIIEALPEMTYAESETGIYSKLAFQAYTLRAYHYFTLVNTFALPWSEENKDKPGVIRRTASVIDVSPTERASIGEIYALINADLVRAEEYLENASGQYSKYEITPSAVYFLASRVALFQENWDEVIRTSRKFIELGNNPLYDLKEVDRNTCGLDYSNDGTFWINDLNVSETVFLFAKKDQEYDFLAPRYSWQYYTLGFHPSWQEDNPDALLNIYEEGDLRREVYFTRMYRRVVDGRNVTYVAGQAYPRKYDSHSNTIARECWRSPEVYLNLAEAYTRKSNEVSPDAVDILNELRSMKFVVSYGAKTTSDFASATDLCRFIWQERRRELCFEEAMRFWDLRRQGMPELTHEYFYAATSSQTFVLPQGSPNYVLPIPLSETDYNDGCTNNQREIIVGR